MCPCCNCGRGRARRLRAPDSARTTTLTEEMSKPDTSGVASGSDPIVLFHEWWETSRIGGPSRHPGAVCVSTVDEQGVPEARIVDLKELSERGFVFGTHLDSPKARALSANSNVALTFWWDHIERQIRVVGRAERLSDSAADALFATRRRDAQITSWASQQSAPLLESTAFEQGLTDACRRFEGGDVPRPPHWGAYCVVPARIEFLEFRESRLHIRTLFERDGTGWRRSVLQP
ncbi:MAG TPA: pyridoxamine 5'-phosphate oxidase [Gemmatimonadaceae bacterium]|nr:pyridoxamine 5'-phosphate oxidase [Gemmatimonadaceae bacterium]